MNETGSRDSTSSETLSAGTTGGQPWGFWGTAGLGVLILAVVSLIQGIAFVLIPVVSGLDPGALSEDPATNGLFLAVSACVGGVLGPLLILFLVRRRKGIGIQDYLCLRLLPWRSLLVWVGICIAVVAAIDGIMLLAGQDVIPEYSISTYRTAEYLPLFWFALVVAAPLYEEFLFRGFLFTGWLNTRLGATGTILLTSALWTLLHFQYDVFGLVQIFVGGIVVGLARYRTASLMAPLVMHGAINLLALVQVAQVV